MNAPLILLYFKINQTIKEKFDLCTAFKMVLYTFQKGYYKKKLKKMSKWIYN